MSRATDRLSLLATFVRIAEAGSISAAARDLGLSQPSVSRQLASLEKRLQTQLARRTTHELALTEAGRLLLADARALLDAWEVLEERHLKAATELRGRLKVVAPIALGQHALAGFAAGFRLEYPRITLTWQLEDRAIRFAEVGCDCWVKVGPVPDDTLIVRRLGRVERLLVAAPGLLGTQRIEHPRDLAQVAAVALTPFEGDALPLTSDEGEHALLRPPVAMSTNNIFALHSAARAGVGMAVLPKWFVQQDLEAGRLHDVLPAWRAPSLDVNVAYAPGRHRPQRLRVFVDALLAAVQSIPGIEA
ncbi:MAG: LysR family transcriptional regulator [Bacteroidota bacterium]